MWTLKSARGFQSLSTTSVIFLSKMLATWSCLYHSAPKRNISLHTHHWQSQNYLPWWLYRNKIRQKRWRLYRTCSLTHSNMNLTTLILHMKIRMCGLTPIYIILLYLATSVLWFMYNYSFFTIYIGRILETLWPEFPTKQNAIYYSWRYCTAMHVDTIENSEK